MTLHLELDQGPLDTPRSYKRPVEEVARAICDREAKMVNEAMHRNFYPAWEECRDPERSEYLAAARVAITRLNDLGFISELGLSALKAEKEGK